MYSSETTLKTNIKSILITAWPLAPMAQPQLPSFGSCRIFVCFLLRG